MDIPIETYAAFLDDAWDAAPNVANSLRGQLRAFEKQVTTLFSQGSIASVGKNSANQSYRGPGVGSFTPAQLQYVWRRLINLFDSTKAEVDQEIAVADSQAPANDGDPVIYARMMLQLQPVAEYQPDITDLLLPPTLTAPMPISIA